MRCGRSRQVPGLSPERRCDLAAASVEILLPSHASPAGWCIPWPTAVGSCLLVSTVGTRGPALIFPPPSLPIKGPGFSVVWLCTTSTTSSLFLPLSLPTEI